MKKFLVIIFMGTVINGAIAMKKTEPPLVAIWRDDDGNFVRPVEVLHSESQWPIGKYRVIKHYSAGHETTENKCNPEGMQDFGEIEILLRAYKEKEKEQYQTFLKKCKKNNSDNSELPNFVVHIFYMKGLKKSMNLFLGDLCTLEFSEEFTAKELNNGSCMGDSFVCMGSMDNPKDLYYPDDFINSMENNRLGDAWNSFVNLGSSTLKADIKNYLKQTATAQIYFSTSEENAYSVLGFLGLWTYKMEARKVYALNGLSISHQKRIETLDLKTKEPRSYSYQGLTSRGRKALVGIGGVALGIGIGWWVGGLNTLKRWLKL